MQRKCNLYISRVYLKSQAIRTILYTAGLPKYSSSMGLGGNTTPMHMINTDPNFLNENMK